MSKIFFDQISENEVEVTLSPETPMEMVNQLTKSLLAKGMVENLEKSTLSVRYFSRTQSNAATLADKLIKSLEDMSGLSKATKPWWADSQADVDNWKAKNKQYNAEDRAKRAGIKPTTQPSTTSISSGANTLPGVPNKVHNPSTSGVINYKMKKQEDHGEDCECSECLSVEKSNYGPKGSSQYSLADNIRRKANNTGDAVGLGPNVNVKAYSSKPGQLSAKQAAAVEAKQLAAKNKNQPVKRATPEEIEAENKRRGFKKSWAEHLPFPSAEEEIMKFAKTTIENGEEAAANQLLKLMAGKSMLGTAPPAQPTNEELFGGGVVTDEMAKSAQNKWNNTFNNWMSEAAKPISQRFTSEEEELAYWSSIKVADRDDGQSGY